MPLIKFSHTIRGIKEDRIFKAGEPVDMTLKRADEIVKNINENDKYNIELSYEQIDAVKKKGESYAKLKNR